MRIEKGCRVISILAFRHDRRLLLVVLGILQKNGLLTQKVKFFQCTRNLRLSGRVIAHLKNSMGNQISLKKESLIQLCAVVENRIRIQRWISLKLILNTRRADIRFYSVKSRVVFQNFALNFEKRLRVAQRKLLRDGFELLRKQLFDA